MGQDSREPTCTTVLESICPYRNICRRTRNYHLSDCSTTLLLRHDYQGGRRYSMLPVRKPWHRRPRKIQNTFIPTKVISKDLRKDSYLQPRCILRKLPIIINYFRQHRSPITLSQSPRALVRVSLVSVTSPPLSKIQSTISIAKVSQTVLNLVSEIFCTIFAID